jgi:hypothetical protein
VLQRRLSAALAAPTRLPDLEAQRREEALRNHIHTRLIAIALAGCALGALAPSASGNGTVRLYRDGSQAVPFIAEVGKGTNNASSHAPALRRDGSKAVPFVADLGSKPSTAGGDFDWGDAGIGAGAGFALTMIGLGGLLVLSNRRHRPEQPAPTA